MIEANYVHAGIPIWECPKCKAPYVSEGMRDKCVQKHYDVQRLG